MITILLKITLLSCFQIQLLTQKQRTKKLRVAFGSTKAVDKGSPVDKEVDKGKLPKAPRIFRSLFLSQKLKLEGLE